MAEKQPLAVYQKDGAEKSAWTPTEAVDLEFHGWTKKATEFDPSAHNASDVNTYLEQADESEVARVLEAERNGKARTSILEGPHAK